MWPHTIDKRLADIRPLIIFIKCVYNGFDTLITDTKFVLKIKFKFAMVYFPSISNYFVPFIKNIMRCVEILPTPVLTYYKKFDRMCLVVNRICQ